MSKEGILSCLCWEFLKGKEHNENHEVLHWRLSQCKLEITLLWTLLKDEYVLTHARGLFIRLKGRRAEFEHVVGVGKMK